jgi:hypothetical protein
MKHTHPQIRDNNDINSNLMKHQHPNVGTTKISSTTLIKNYIKSEHLIIPNVTPSKPKWKSQLTSKYQNHKRVNDVKLS